MDRTTGRAAYRACRDILVRHRDDSTPPSQRSAGPTSATSSTGRSTGSIPSRLPIEPRPTQFSPMPAEILHPINASGALNSWNYRRPSPAKSDVSNCGLPKTLAIQMI
jgi:hypothetical protein